GKRKQGRLELYGRQRSKCPRPSNLILCAKPSTPDLIVPLPLSFHHYPVGQSCGALGDSFKANFMVNVIRHAAHIETCPKHKSWPQCVTTMKSVSFPVSSLMPWSDTISEEPGVSNSEIRSTASCGISMRSRAALALAVNGTCGAAPRGSSSGIDTTVQRVAAPSFGNFIAVNTCVPNGSCGFRILTGASNSGVKPCRTKSLLNLRLTKTEIGIAF